MIPFSHLSCIFCNVAFFFGVQGGTAVKHRARSGVSLWCSSAKWFAGDTGFKDPCPSHVLVPARVLQFTALSVVPL